MNIHVVRQALFSVVTRHAGNIIHVFFKPPCHCLAFRLATILSSVTERVAELIVTRHRGHRSPLLSRTSCRQAAQNEWPQPRVVALLNSSRHTGHWSSSDSPAPAGLFSTFRSSGPDWPDRWRVVWLVVSAERCRGIAPFRAVLAVAVAPLV